MIAFSFYRTYGGGKTHFVRKGRNRWQRVARFLCFYWPTGPQIIEHEYNYFR